MFAVAKQEVYSASTVEFGFTNNSLGVDGSFIGPKAQFDPSRNSVVLWSSPRAEIKEDMKGISVIVSAVEEGLPTIISDGCLYWDSKRQIAPRWWFGRYG